MKFLPGPLFAVAAIVALAADPPFAQVSNLTATAILGWYAWYTATKTIPQMMESFRRELATERTQHRTDRDAFLREMTEQRVQRHNDTAAIVVAVNELTALIKFSNNPIAADPPTDDQTPNAAGDMGFVGRPATKYRFSGFAQKGHCVHKSQ